jgi:hypothetical protein
MRIVRSIGLITVVTLLSGAALVLLLHETPFVSAQTGTPPSSISSSSGPVSWDFAAVGGGTVTNQTMTAKLTIKYTWTSTVPTDLDIFAISPGGADHGPGSPDNTSTGPGEEDLTVTDPVDGSGTSARLLRSHRCQPLLTLC